MATNLKDNCSSQSKVKKREMFFLNRYTLHTFIYKYALESTADPRHLLHELSHQARKRNSYRSVESCRYCSPATVLPSVSSPPAATGFPVCSGFFSTRYVANMWEHGIGPTLLSARNPIRPTSHCSDLVLVQPPIGPTIY